MVKHVKPMISVAAMSGLLETIRAAGANPDQVVRTFELHPSVLANAEGFIPCAVFPQILEEAARVTGDDCFGLHFGERFNPKNIGPLVYVVLNSPTVAAADEHAARYLKLYNQAAKASFVVEGRYAYLQYVLADLGIEPPRQQNEYGMVVRLNTIRMMVGSQWSLSRCSSLMKCRDRFRSISEFLARPFHSAIPVITLLSSVSSLSARFPRRTVGFTGS